MQVSITVIYCMCSMYVCLHAHFACTHFVQACLGWCNAEACFVPTIPSFSFFAAPSKEAEPLCVCQPSSLGPIVKLSKPVCSGDALTYRTGTGDMQKRNGEFTEQNCLGWWGGAKDALQQWGRQSWNDRGKEKDIGLSLSVYVKWSDSLNVFPPCLHPFPS